jgi:hypothetical protein
LSELIPDLIAAAVLVVVPGLVILNVFRRERTRYRERRMRPDAAVVRAKCGACGITLAAAGLLYVRDVRLVCADCRRCLGGAQPRDLTAAELSRLIAEPGERSRRFSG